MTDIKPGSKGTGGAGSPEDPRITGVGKKQPQRSPKAKPTQKTSGEKAQSTGLGDMNAIARSSRFNRTALALTLSASAQGPGPESGIAPDASAAIHKAQANILNRKANEVVRLKNPLRGTATEWRNVTPGSIQEFTKIALGEHAGLTDKQVERGLNAAKAKAEETGTPVAPIDIDAAKALFADEDGGVDIEEAAKDFQALLDAETIDGVVEGDVNEATVHDAFADLMESRSDDAEAAQLAKELGLTDEELKTISQEMKDLEGLEDL